MNIKVVRQDSAAFYDTTWLKAPLYTTYWGTNDSVLFFGRSHDDLEGDAERDRLEGPAHRRPVPRAVGDPSGSGRDAGRGRRSAAPAVRAGRLLSCGAWPTASTSPARRARACRGSAATGGCSSRRAASPPEHAARGEPDGGTRGAHRARTLVTIALVAVAVFLLTEALPGDATSGLVERGASPAAVAAARAELGLDAEHGRAAVAALRGSRAR